MPSLAPGRNSVTGAETCSALVGWRGTLLAALVSILVGLSAQWPGLASPYVVNDDVRQQLFWMQRWIDPTLYPPDLLNEYARLYVSWGVRGLYRLGSIVWEPLFFSKFVAVGLFAWLGALLFQTGRALRDQALGLAVLGVFWLAPVFMENISGGLARAFAAPLLALFFYALVVRSHRLANAALLCQALFIPYILLPCLAASALHLAAWRLRLTSTEPLLRGWRDVLLAGLALGLAMAWQHGLEAAGFGPLPWASEVMGRPEFRQGGRLALLPLPSPAWELVGRPWGSIAPFRELGIATGVAVSVLLAPLLALGALRADWRSLRPHAPAATCMLLASLGLYLAACLALFKLFVPSRYLEYATNLSYCLGMAICLDALLRRIPRGVGLALLGAALVAGVVRQHGVELFDYSGDRVLYEYARATPPASRFAGLPDLMDNVLTFGRRNVYVSSELAHPWSVGLWRELGPRLERLTRAYYSADPDTVRRFCGEEGVDYLVVDRRHFARAFMSGHAVFEPFGALVRERAKDPAPFALLSGAFAGVAVGPDVTVYDMRPGSANQAGSVQKDAPLAAGRAE